MSLISTMAVTCLVIGPAQTRENYAHYKILQPLEISEGVIRTTSMDQNSQFENLEFRIVQDNSDACPGAVVAKDRKGRMAALKGLYTGEVGYVKGAILFEDENEIVYRALIECPSIVLNPKCKSPREVVEGWELL